MKFTFTSGPLTKAPKGFTRVRLTEDQKGTRRLVREGGEELLEIGTGKQGEITLRTFVPLVRSIAQTAKKERVKKIALEFPLATFPKLKNIEAPELAAIVAQNLLMATYEFTAYKTEPKDGFRGVTDVCICGATPKAVQDGFKKGQTIGEEVNACRELANTPGGDMTPKSLAKAAKMAVAGLPVTVRTLGVPEMKKLGMGAILGVGRGSAEAPTFTILEYKGGTGKPIILAGKGITFDSGGINLKNGDGHEMHMDMSGAAAVIHAVALAAKLKSKKHVIGLVPAAENMPGGNSLRPHDILTSLSGKTIEVINTDAEGRLVLADALTYAKRFKPGVVIDVATLTGGSLSALGLYASGLLTRDDKLADQLLTLSETAGDYLWRLPMWDVYEDSVKSGVADVANCVSGGAGRYASATNGGMFLWQFAKELGCPWAHLDIAPRMTSAPGDELAKGAAGEPVRLLYAFIEEWK
jgi:leucyl aminopeptidase